VELSLISTKVKPWGLSYHFHANSTDLSQVGWS